jgi:hypothetical protein
MNIYKLLSLIPEQSLEQLAIETKVDYYAKKLQGEVIFKLLLYCIVSHKNNSLRTMESAYEKATFQLLNQKYNRGTIRFSSISERLSNINAEYFEKLYQQVVSAYKKELGKTAADLVRFDSTIVALSSKLLTIGYTIKGGEAENVKQLKFTIGFSDIPEIVHFFTEQKYTSENVALKQSILEHSKIDGESIKVFDRGITGREAYDQFTEGNIQFVTRLNDKARFEVEGGNNNLKEPIETSTLSIVNDTWCYLLNSNRKRTRFPVRRIEAIRLETGEQLVFITNIKDLNAAEITEIYKSRWDIEVFFKFIKQLLNFAHLINRTENGVKVILYVTMIAAILLIAYKKNNNLSGFKIVKQRFEQELETSLIKDIITMCGGDPTLLNKVIRSKGP